MKKTRASKLDHEKSQVNETKDIPTWLKVFAAVFAFSITTGIALAALIISLQGQSAVKSGKTLADKQIQQIAELQRTTPTGEITRIIAYPRNTNERAIANMRNDPVLRQQVYNLSGTASNVPDNGSLFMIVHDYGAPTSTFNDPPNHFFITHVILSGKNDVDQHWQANGVYIGEKSAPSTPLSYRLTLYFCNSVDSAKIVENTASSAALNNGLPSLPYPSCEQLDSVFVIRS